MIAPIVDRMLSFNLGEPGRYIVELVQNNLFLFLTIFAIYGGTILYAKFIWSEYIPEKMKEFLNNKTEESKTPEELFQQWLIQRHKLPKYILVPTKNEWWVRPAAKMTGQEKMLFYNSKRNKLTEKERFFLVTKELGIFANRY
ncbi:hypothetical protein [Enterococcus casseliflavus]|uniref:hypothetical protein n=1 Tax=Enterococcus casseliflavus TaxID=37734 RepID=UPI001BD1805B|nr:hypothetical protein [Enterococcus casseliflavus]